MLRVQLLGEQLTVDHQELMVQSGLLQSAALYSLFPLLGHMGFFPLVDLFYYLFFLGDIEIAPVTNPFHISKFCFLDLLMYIPDQEL